MGTCVSPLCGPGSFLLRPPKAASVSGAEPVSISPLAAVFTERLATRLLREQAPPCTHTHERTRTRVHACTPPTFCGLALSLPGVSSGCGGGGGGKPALGALSCPDLRLCPLTLGLRRAGSDSWKAGRVGEVSFLHLPLSRLTPATVAFGGPPRGRGLLQTRASGCQMTAVSVRSGA